MKDLTWKIHIEQSLHTNVNCTPLINFNSTLRIKRSLLMYISKIRPLQIYTCPVWATASQTKMKKTLNKINFLE